MDFLSQLWKEYALGDSRYMTKDSFTVCMESITAFVEGPLCFFTVWCFVKQYSCRYLCQLCVSLGQFYGCVLYFLTAWMEDFKHGPMYHPLYFWFYFVFMNVIWIVIPLLLIIDSWRSLSDVQSRLDKASQSIKRKQF
ncbi:EBP [Bugula neritina]|uniref:EBP n=1 Tax=Bugula neritina TaxID=10212 RepID=A0A7J7K398_BUGNE|nr:EBP [Bugula neritina]